MELFFNLINAGILGITSFYLVVFLDFCTNDGNIFDWYYILILNYIKPKSPKWAKVLAMCPICFGFWVSTALFVLYHFKLGIDIAFYFPYIALCQYNLIKKFAS
jgi:hypothetical protein